MVHKLSDPIKVGSIDAKNRIFMAPLTRARATKDFIPTPIMAEYYAQRSDAGLIISEATAISLQGQGWPRAPGIWNDKQVEAWKPITEAVHKKGGKIICQLWHMGRTSHSKVNGLQPVAPSAIATPEPIHTYEGKLPAEVPHALTKDDIKKTLGDYENAAKNAIKAGFDGVQIHGANGYLIDEFLKTSTNKRTDEYGGSPENRVRFLREVVDTVVKAVGAENVAIRLSPNASTLGAEFEDGNPEPDTRLAAKIFEEYKLAFVELREAGPNGTFGASTQPFQHGVVREEYSGPIVLNQDLNTKEAEDYLAKGTADAISFGRGFINHPDLVKLVLEDKPWKPSADPKGWYIDGSSQFDDVPRDVGYTDYPTSS